MVLRAYTVTVASVAGNGSVLYVPPASVTLTVGVAGVIVPAAVAADVTV